MIVYPAIDLMGGRCVRLKQGRFDEATHYEYEPALALASFAGAGASWAHVVDLDGARSGKPAQHELIAELARTSSLKLQVAGGFRTEEQVAHMLDQGASRIVLGSLAIEQPGTVRRLLSSLGPERIALALDVNIVGGEPIVAFGGWAKTSSRSLFDLVEGFSKVRHVLVTDISRDGMRSGANVELVEAIARTFPKLRIQASGGVAEAGEIPRLAAAGAAGAIIGKALWEGHIDLGEAVAHARS